MSKYFDFVLCRHQNGKKELMYAPEFSYLKAGDMVVVDTDKGEMTSVVLASLTMRDDQKKEIDFVMKATNSPKDLHRIISKVIFEKMKYEEEEEHGNL